MPDEPTSGGYQPDAQTANKVRELPLSLPLTGGYRPDAETTKKVQELQGLIPPKLQAAFESQLLAAYKEAVEEIRRSFEKGTSFYEKLATVDAGSMAVAASIAIALTARPDLRQGSLQAIPHGLVLVTVFFWVSLTCAVAHNFFIVWFTKLEAAYAEDDFVRKITRGALGLAKESGTGSNLAFLQELEQKAQEEPMQKQKRNVALRQFLRPCASVLGYVSVACFLAAYSIVGFWVVRFWWINL